MALSSTASGDSVLAADVQQFMDLLTGVMTDQDVTLKQTLTIGGSQGTTENLLVLSGVASQTGDFMRVVPSGLSPTFSINSSGKMVYDAEMILNDIGTPTAPAAAKTALYSKSSSGDLRVIRNGGSEDAIVLLAATQTLTAKTLTSPTITTPTIASFASATHNHTDGAGGGAIVGSDSIIAIQVFS